MKKLLFAITAFVIGISLNSITSAEPANGEEKCGPDGSVLRYEASSHTWRETVARCDGGSASSGRAADRRDPPSNGDQRCGPDGYVLRYDANAHSWSQTVERCQ